MWVIGNMDYLAARHMQDDNWNKMCEFVSAVAAISPPVDGSEHSRVCHTLALGTEQDTESLCANIGLNKSGPGNTLTETDSGIYYFRNTKKSMIAQTDIGSKHGWNAGAIHKA